MKYDVIKEINKTPENRLYFAARAVLEQLEGSGIRIGPTGDTPVNLVYCMKLIRLFKKLDEYDLATKVSKIVESCHTAKYGIGDGTYTYRRDLVESFKRELKSIARSQNTFEVIAPTNTLLTEVRDNFVTISIDMVLSLLGIQI